MLRKIAAKIRKLEISKSAHRLLVKFLLKHTSLLKPPNDSFCILPWIQIHSTSTGSFRICCDSTNSKDFVGQNQQKLFMHESDIEDVWNCGDMRRFRTKMLKGEKLKECECCYATEKAAGTSTRLTYFMTFNKEYRRLKKAGVFDQTLRDNGKSVFNPRFLNMALSNKCNLSCRMCYPRLSSTKAKEVFQLRAKAIEQGDDYQPNSFAIIDNDIQPNPSSAPQDQFQEFQKHFDFIDKDSYWRQIEKCAPYLNHLFLHGGEPLLSAEKIERVFDRIVEHRREKEVTIWMVTNLTVLDDAFLSKMASIQWRSLNLAFSVDGINALQEYIRYPVKWKKFDRNLRKVMARAKDFDVLSTSITVQAYNVFQLTDLLDYMESFWDIKRVQFQFSFLRDPDYLRPDVLPREIREQAIDKLNDFKTRSKSINSGNGIVGLEDSINVIIHGLKHEDGNVEQRRGEFIRYTKALDDFNRQNILTVCPELAPLFNELSLETRC